jgi:alpha-galactosidase
MKIAIMGAGARFTPGLVTEMARQPALAGTTVALYDLDVERTQLMERWGKRYLAEQAFDATVRAVSDLQPALEGADFVFSTIRVGGGDAYAADLAVPARYGIEQGVGDSVGAGGFFASLRQIPAFVALARAMDAACPGAWRSKRCWPTPPSPPSNRPATSSTTSSLATPPTCPNSTDRASRSPI